MGSPLRLVPRGEIPALEWDAVADAADQAWLWHRHTFQDVLCTWPGRRDISFAVRESGDRGRILALVPLHRIERKPPVLPSVNLLDSLGGPALVNDLSEKIRGKLMDFIACTLRDLAGSRCLQVRLALPAMAPAWRGETIPRVNPLLTLGCRNTLGQTWVVDLRPGLAAVWKRFEGRARTAIRKAEKSGVTVRLADRPGDLDTYYRLHVETYRRTGATPHPQAYFESIWRQMAAAGLAKIFFAEAGGEIVAAENFAAYKRSALYWTGAASSRGLELEANSLLQWHAMQWMCQAGLEWYETGEAFPSVREGKLKGLNDFKKGFGGEMYPYHRGELALMSLPARLYRCYAQWQG